MAIIREKLISIIDNDTNEFHKIIASKILNYLNKELKPKIQEIADECYTDKSTISRFIKMLGYSGFTAFFEKALLEENFSFLSEGVDDIKEYHSYFQSTFNKKIECVNEHSNKLTLIAKKIKDMQKVFIINSSENEDSANNLADILQVMDVNVKHVKDRAIPYLENIVDEHCMIIFLLSGINSKSVLRTFDSFLEHNPYIVCIVTDTQKDKIKKSDIMITITSEHFLPWIMSRKIIFAYIVEYLIFTIMSENKSLFEIINKKREFIRK